MYKVYWNLHKKKFSIKEDNLPVRHETLFLLCNCRFAVSKKGRTRVITEKRRNVHAYIYAENFVDLKIIQDQFPLGQVRYNPYRGEHFTLNDTPIFTAKYLLCRVVNNKYNILVYN